MDARLMSVLGRSAAVLEKRARSRFLTSLFQPGLEGAERAMMSRQVGGALQRGELTGLAGLLGTNFARVESNLANRALGLHTWPTSPSLSRSAQEYLAHAENLPLYRNSAAMFDQPGTGQVPGMFADEIAEAKAGLASGRNSEAAREVARYRMNKRLNQWTPERADQIAMSGRHGGATTFNPTMDLTGDPVHNQTYGPSEAYKGFTSVSPLRPDTGGAVRDPQWWSGYPGVASGYALPVGRLGPTGNSPFTYVAQAPTRTLHNFGPSSPSFHQHLGVDTRAFSGAAVANYPRFQAGNSAWAALPHYESVFTRPEVPIGQYSNLYKALPSGRGLQHVGGPFALPR